MRKYTVRLAAICTLIGLLASCNKHKNPKSSWMIDGKTYTSRELKGYILTGIPTLRYTTSKPDQEYSWGVQFIVSFFPTSGVYQLRYNVVSTDQFAMKLYKGGSEYAVANYNNTSMNCYAENGRGKYVLEPTWFFRLIPDESCNCYLFSQDSVLVSGTFYESEDLVIR